MRLVTPDCQVLDIEIPHPPPVAEINVSLNENQRSRSKLSIDEFTVPLVGRIYREPEVINSECDELCDQIVRDVVDLLGPI